MLFFVGTQLRTEPTIKPDKCKLVSLLMVTVAILTQIKRKFKAFIVL